VINTKRIADRVVLHEGKVLEGFVSRGDAVVLTVTSERRNDIALNHTATHLLHAAMKRILGDHIKQAGSLVEEERLRFDFTHFSPLTPEEIRTIEQAVNAKIRENIPVTTAVQARTRP
jgi:alanyl-tRNA synthetase